MARKRLQPTAMYSIRAFTIPPTTSGVSQTFCSRTKFREVLQRSMDPIPFRQISAQLWDGWPEQRPVLQHLQPLPVPDPDHDRRRLLRTAHIVDTTELTMILRTARCLPSLTSSRGDGLTAIRPRPVRSVEGFTKKIVDAVKGNPELWESTAIFITVDEGGG